MQYQDEHLKQFQLEVLSYLCQDQNTALVRLNRILTSGCFWEGKPRFYYDAFISLTNEGYFIDIISLEDYCLKLGLHNWFQSNKPNISKDIKWFHSHEVNEDNAILYAQTLARRHYRMRLIESTQALKDKLAIASDDMASEELTSMLTSYVRDNVVLADNSSEPMLFADMAEEYIEHLCSQEPSIPGIDIGFPQLEQANNGIRPGTVTAILARMKIGKSFLLLNSAVNAALKDTPVLYLDTEMQKEEQIERIISRFSGIMLDSIISRSFTSEPQQILKVRDAFGKLKQMPFYWRKIPGLSVDQYIGVMEEWVAKHVGYEADGTAKHCLIVLDYIKLTGGDLGNDAKDAEHKQLGDISTKIKNFANENRVPILTALQANRAFMQGAGTGGIAGSDAIARSVDGIWVYDEKTESQMSEDNSDLGEYAGNLLLKPLVARSAGKFGSQDYICVDFNGAYATANELQRRSIFRKTKTKSEPKKVKKKSDANDVLVPGEDYRDFIP